MMTHLPIRLRLTLVFTLSMAVLLAVAGSFVYLRLGAELRHSTDTALLTQADAITAGLGQQGATFSPPTAGGLGTFAQVLGPGGKVLESSPGLAGGPAVPPSSLAAVRGPAYFNEVVRGINGIARIVVLPQGAGPQRVWVLAGTSSQNRDGVLSALLVLMVAGSLVTLVLAGAGGWAVAGAALRPVERMRQEADAISVSDRGRRLPIPASRDEIARLGNTLNAMLARLEAAFDRERRFVDDASHELRTPLAILKAELDLAQTRPRTNAELVAAVHSASEEADRLSSLAETLLVYSRTEGDRMPLRPEPTDLEQLLLDVRSSLGTRAAAAGVTVRVEPHLVTAVVDPVRIRQAVENLVSNALAHTPRGGLVLVRASAAVEGECVCVAVQDTGPGFDAGLLPRLFEPFITGTGHGAGLGLAIVRAVAEAHGGTAVAENPPGGGARVTICLPCGG
jgi:signal transduction histidine kinase